MKDGTFNIKMTKFNILIKKLVTRGGAVGLGTVLQVGRSRV
jgi:hypothetical protein